MSRVRSFIGTWNNYPNDWETKYTKLFSTTKFKYIIGASEVGAEGTPHIQTHFDLVCAKTLTAFQKLLQKHDIRMAIKVPTDTQHAANNRNYCEKEEDYKVWGCKPSQGQRTDLQSFMAYTKNSSDSRLTMMETHPMIFAKYSRFANEYITRTRTAETLNWSDEQCPNIWMYGPPGSGKSSQFQGQPSTYLKDDTKWWDNYDGEDTVLIEELGPEHKHLLRFLKIWADRYPFNAEVKGGYSGKIRPKRIVVTSNYRPIDIWSNDDVLPLIRRFQVVEKIAQK